MEIIDKARNEKILDVINKAGGVTLKRKGSTYVGLCPFHDEKTPSFNVSERRNSFKCFGCGVGGDGLEYVKMFLSLDFKKTLNWFADTFNYTQSGPSTKKKIQGVYEKVKNTGKWEVKTKDFTDAELRFLGPFVTAEICKELNFYSVEYYILPDGHKWKSTDDYFMFVTDYKDWKKLYQPKAEKSLRFLQIDYKNKSKDFIYGYDRIQAKRVKEAEEKKRNYEIDNDIDPDDAPDLESYLNKVEVIKASGDRDALNLASLGFNPVYLDSETDVFTSKQLHKMLNISKVFYNLPDIDKTGIRYAFDLALSHLKTKTVWLPESLLQQRDERGYGKKDFTDYCKNFQPKDYENKDLVNEQKDKLIKSFEKIKGAAIELEFWRSAKNKNGSWGYEFDDTSLYEFLQANGYYKYRTPREKTGYIFVRLLNNIIEEVKAFDVAEHIHKWLKTSYKEPKIRNTAFRTNKLKESSLANLATVEIDTKLYGHDFQYFTFKSESSSRPRAWKITRYGIEEQWLQNKDKYIWSDKVQNFSPTITKQPFFKVRYSKEYEKLLFAFDNAPEHETKKILQASIDEFEAINKYEIELPGAPWAGGKREDCKHEHQSLVCELCQATQVSEFSFLQFIINISNFWWEKQLKGEELEAEEIKNFKLHLINKLFALGYLLSNHKQPSKPWAVFCIDGENVDVGIHQGGTGKSIYAKSPLQLLSWQPIKGQNPKIADDKHVYAAITKDTDYVLVNDCHVHMDFHFFLNELEGELTVNPKHNKAFALPFEDVPKFCFTSNNAIKNIDGSIIRRILYCCFSTYYHSEGGAYATKFDPRQDFGKDLFSDYNETEWNWTYNLFANCVSLFFQFPNEKISPPSDEIGLKSLKRSITGELLDWLSDYFFDDISVKAYKEAPIWEQEFLFVEDMYNEFKDAHESNFKNNKFFASKLGDKKRFKQYVVMFCRHFDIVVNPDDVKGYDKYHDRIRKKDTNGKLSEIFYFRKPHKKQNVIRDQQHQPVNSLNDIQLKDVNEEDDNPF